MESQIRAGLVSLTTASVLALAVAAAIASRPAFTSSWLAPDVAGVSFAGKRVAALVITSDEHLRISGEEQLARELSARTMHGVATYRIVPREETASAERARPWLERAGIEGVVALRPVSAETDVATAPTFATTGSYSTLWGYYGYGWTAAFTPGAMRADTRLVVETLVYSLSDDKLLWAGVSTTTNPKEAQAFIKELVAAAVKEMQKNRIGS